MARLKATPNFAICCSTKDSVDCALDTISGERRNRRARGQPLAGNPSRLPAEPVKMKLFFESDEDDLSAEVYLNFSVLERHVQFHEKDQDFRRPLVLALGENQVL